MGPSAAPGSSVLTALLGPHVPSAATALLGGPQLRGETRAPVQQAGRACTGLQRRGLLQAPCVRVASLAAAEPRAQTQAEHQVGLERESQDTVAGGAVGSALALVPPPSPPATLSERQGRACLKVKREFSRVLGRLGVSPSGFVSPAGPCLRQAFSPQPQPVHWLCLPVLQGPSFTRVITFLGNVFIKMSMFL